jgi:hypothetical protein
VAPRPLPLCNSCTTDQCACAACCISGCHLPACGENWACTTAASSTFHQSRKRCRNTQCCVCCVTSLFPATSECLYTVLGVDAAASADEIKVAFRKLALRLHPDVNPAVSQTAEQALDTARSTQQHWGDRRATSSCKLQRHGSREASFVGLLGPCHLHKSSLQCVVMS